MSNSLQLMERSLVLDISGIQRRSWLKQKDPAFLVRHWTMLHTTRHNDKFALFDPFVAIAKIHAETAFHHQKQLIFVFVMVKHKLTFEFVELYILTVEFTGDVRPPVFGDPSEFVGDVHLGMRSSA